MKILFFVILTLFLIITQTVILPSFSWFDQCFDLLIIDVFFLSLVSSHYSAIFPILFIGLVMDSISGVSLGHHIFSYFWIYFIVLFFKRLIFQESILFILIVSGASVLIQQGLLFFSVFINNGYNVLWRFDFGLAIQQVFWGMVFIPVGVRLVSLCWQWRVLGVNSPSQDDFLNKDRG